MKEEFLVVPLDVPGIPKRDDRSSVLSIPGGEFAGSCLSSEEINRTDCFILRLPGIWQRKFNLLLAPAFLDYWLYSDFQRAKKICSSLIEANKDVQRLTFDVGVVNKGKYAAEIDQMVKQHLAFCINSPASPQQLKQILGQSETGQPTPLSVLKGLAVGSGVTFDATTTEIKFLPNLPSLDVYSKADAAVDYAFETRDLDAASALGNFKLQGRLALRLKRTGGNSAEAILTSFYWRIYDEYSFEDRQPLGVWKDPDVPNSMPIALWNSDFRALRERKSSVSALLATIARKAGKEVPPELQCQNFKPVTTFVKYDLPPNLSVQLSI